MIVAQDNLSRVHGTFERYWKLTRKTRAESLSYLAQNFARFFSQRLSKAAMPKGAITAERLGAINSGLKISDRAKSLVYSRYGISASIKSRRLQSNKKTRATESIGRLIVAQELRLREGHRTFTTSAAKFKGALKVKTAAMRKGETLGMGTPIAGGIDKDSFEFDWGSDLGKWSGVATIGIKKRAGLADAALNDARKNMIVYIERKQKEAARSAARSFR